MINGRSRYVAATFQSVDTDRGRVLAIYTPPVSFGGVPYSRYLTIEGDTWDLLAYKVYKDPTAWWKIADANPHVFDPGPIPPGTMIRIPQ